MVSSRFKRQINNYLHIYECWTMTVYEILTIITVYCILLLNEPYSVRIHGRAKLSSNKVLCLSSLLVLFSSCSDQKSVISKKIAGLTYLWLHRIRSMYLIRDIWMSDCKNKQKTARKPICVKTSVVIHNEYRILTNIIVSPNQSLHIWIVEDTINMLHQQFTSTSWT